MRLQLSDRLRVGWLNGFSFIWEGAARAEDAQGTPTQIHISPSRLVYEETPQGTILPECLGKGRDFPVPTNEHDPIPVACSLVSGPSMPHERRLTRILLDLTDT